MRFYQQPHRFYCGVDLHARTMYLCILDHAGQALLHREFPAQAGAFVDAIAPYRDGLVVAVECMFAWYWLADLCAEHGIPFVLGHALYMKAIHQGKSKNDRLDAAKIAGADQPVGLAARARARAIATRLGDDELLARETKLASG